MRGMIVVVLVAIGSLVHAQSAAAESDISEDVRQSFVSCGLLDGETAALPVHPGVCMRPWIDQLYEAYGVGPVLAEFADIYENENVDAYHCHSMFHQLGGEVALAEGETLELGALWTLCGSGFLHGVFERMPLNGTPEEAGRQAVASCTAQDFADETYTYFDCVHSNGHAIFAAFSDIELGEVACAAGALSGAGHRPEILREQCLGGLYMSASDRLINPDNPSVPQDAKTWEGTFSHCRGADSPVECALSFSRFAARDAASSTSFLDWCLDLAGGDELCMERLGMDLGTLGVVTGRSEYGKLCRELVEAHSFSADLCRNGLVAAASEAGAPGALADGCGSDGDACSVEGSPVALIVVGLAGITALSVLATMTVLRRRGRSPESVAGDHPHGAQPLP